MDMIKMFQKELDKEAQITRKMLSIIPEDKYDWKPHPKSMNLRHLATHIAELPSWITMAITTSGLDFASNPYTQEPVNNNEELVAYFERSLAEGKAHLAEANEELLSESWTLRNGKDIFDVSPKSDVIRVCISQTIHHRAQLGVFLRLLNVPIPGSYGPSADELGL